MREILGLWLKAIEPRLHKIKRPRDRTRHICKGMLRKWEQATGISQKRQVEFAGTKAHNGRKDKRSKKARIEAEQELVQLQKLEAQKRHDVSVARI